MTIEQVKAYLTECGLGDRVQEFNVSSATVELAAQALGCDGCLIAKTMSFLVDGQVALVVLAGDARIDNAKFKQHFGMKAKMLSADKVEPLIGHGVGGVCPFGVNEGVDIHLDKSLQRFETVYPAAGTSASAVHLSLAELERASEAIDWVDVCK